MFNYKSISTPSASALSSKVTIDFDPVPLNDLQSEVVARTLNYLGKTTYNLVKRKLKSALLTKPAMFCEVEICFMMIGIEGSTTLLMLLSKWNLDDYVIDYNKHMNDFLDSRNNITN